MNTTRNAEGLGPSRDRLYVTHCCRDKEPAGGDPSMYRAARVRRFIDKCRADGVPWAIFSAEYALFFPDERHDEYDTTLHFRRGQLHVYRRELPLSPPESEAHVRRLVQGVRLRLEGLGFDRVEFYVQGRRPTAYLLVMHRALDDCLQEHGSADEVRQCIEAAGRLHVVTNIGDLEKAIAGCEFHHSQVTALSRAQAAQRRQRSDHSATRTGGPKSDGFREALKGLLEEAERSGQSHVEVLAGDLHRGVGGYPGRRHNMPGCVGVMRAEMGPGDEVVNAPPSGKGASVIIRYRLPRGSRKEGE